MEVGSKLGSKADARSGPPQRLPEAAPSTVLDVKIQRRFGGADSTWYDFFSVAKKQPRKT